MVWRLLTETSVYGSDAIYRLSSETVADVSGTQYQTAFTYDPVSNRLSQDHTREASSTLTTYTYDQRDRVLEAGQMALTWDASGNLTEKAGEASFSWGTENRLTSVELADWEPVRPALLYGMPFERTMFPPKVVDGFIEIMHHLRHGSKTLPVLYMGFMQTEGGAIDFDKHGRTYSHPT